MHAKRGEHSQAVTIALDARQRAALFGTLPVAAADDDEEDGERATGGRAFPGRVQPRQGRGERRLVPHGEQEEYDDAFDSPEYQKGAYSPALLPTPYGDLSDEDGDADGGGRSMPYRVGPRARAGGRRLGTDLEDDPDGEFDYDGGMADASKLGHAELMRSRSHRGGHGMGGEGSRDRPGRMARTREASGLEDPAGPQAEALPSNPAMGKFVDDLGDVDPSTPSSAAEALTTLAYGDMSDFQRGLTGLLGPPEEGDAQAAMLAEHCTRPDSQEWFSVGNYGTTTTSEIEYAYVVNPTQAALEQLRLGDAGWPREARLIRAGPDFASCMRKPRPLSDFEAQRAKMDLRVRELTGGAFPLEALIGGRLYTGPLFVKVRASDPATEPGREGRAVPCRALLLTLPVPCLAPSLTLFVYLCRSIRHAFASTMRCCAVSSATRQSLPCVDLKGFAAATFT